MNNLYLIEFYTKEGFINFAWVNAENSKEAKEILSNHSMFGEVIQTSEQIKIFPLSGVKNPVVIIDGKER